MVDVLGCKRLSGDVVFGWEDGYSMVWSVLKGYGVEKQCAARVRGQRALNFVRLTAEKLMQAPSATSAGLPHTMLTSRLRGVA